MNHIMDGITVKSFGIYDGKKLNICHDDDKIAKMNVLYEPFFELAYHRKLARMLMWSLYKRCPSKMPNKKKEKLWRCFCELEYDDDDKNKRMLSLIYYIYLRRVMRPFTDVCCESSNEDFIRYTDGHKYNDEGYVSFELMNTTDTANFIDAKMCFDDKTHQELIELLNIELNEIENLIRRLEVADNETEKLIGILTKMRNNLDQFHDEFHDYIVNG